MNAKSMRKGTVILFRNQLFIVTDFRHHTPGNKRGFVQASLKNLKSGQIIQNRFSSDEPVDRAVLDPKNCQYLYHDGQGYHFMDMESYHSFSLPEDSIGEARYYLKENMEVKIDFHDGEPVAPEFPKVVVLRLKESPPWVRGDSVSNNMKPAVTETGLQIQVPIFLQEGEEIRVNTDTGEYLGRA